MLKITVTCFALVSVLFLGRTLNYADQPKQKSSGMLTGTLQKMIVENGSVTMNVDLNGLNGSNDLNGETRSTTVCRGNELFLSDSRFQRPVARSRTGLNRAGSARPASPTASRCAGWIS
jgi:hypothetical protein